ncbi:fasciclin domain-containing protein [Paraflavisolibacter sp. H34]|uniref:fasciclin domain-containing protein n=1 Tax=Huijunlia imazamoxiresistens TaxID=3127457 RepID=UPI003019C5FD
MMYYLRKILPLISLTLLFTQCTKKEFDSYYARPESLEPPIYQTLEKKGNFKHFLSIIDKSGYKQTLSTAGYWTIFAPNDDAFTKFFTERGITGVDKIDSAAARAMVQYMLTYNAFTKERLDDFQASSGWMVDQAFRRRTAYYTGFYEDTTATGEKVKAIQSNRNGNTAPYVNTDNNNKYITYFTDVYMGSKGLGAADYNYFYPNSKYSGFNVGEANVVNKDLATENGVIHEIDRVITPLSSIDEYLRGKPQYSEFKKLYDKYMVGFILNADATSRYRQLTGKNDPVFVKSYNSLLPFSLNNENFEKLMDNDGQQGCWTLFVPTNEVLQDYIKNTVLEYYGTFEAAPTSILVDLLKSHMWKAPVWPTKFGTTNNTAGEEARFNWQTDVIDRQVLSNGFLYGTNKVQDANVFSTVYSRAYLDPKYSIMNRLLGFDGLNLQVSDRSPGARFTLFMMPDAVLRAAGYDFNTNSNTFTFPGISSAETVRQNLLRILNTSIIPGDLSDVTKTSGIAPANNTEFIKWNNGQIITAGTLDNSQVVRVDSTRDTKNGKVYYLNGLLTFTSLNIGKHILNLGDTASATLSDFNYFAKYLVRSGSGTYNTATSEIVGTTAGTSYTVLVPSNAAVMQAVKDGVLPGNTTTGAPNFNSGAWTADQKTQVTNFILYHILAKKSWVPGVQPTKESNETLLKDAAGEPYKVSVDNQQNAMTISDRNSKSSANVVIGKSNNLSNRTVIHLIDNYIKY